MLTTTGQTFTYSPFLITNLEYAAGMLFRYKLILVMPLFFYTSIKLRCKATHGNLSDLLIFQETTL